jgi:DNA-binding transcriptional regulator GbsR (MarR family)
MGVEEQTTRDADGRAPDAERRFIEQFALDLTDSGMPRMPSRVFACVLAEDRGRLTAGEIAERLQVSPAAVSGAVRYLVQVGMLQRGRDPGARSDHYGLSEDDPWYTAIADRTALVERWERTAGLGADLLGDARPAGRRLRETQEFFAFMREEIPGLLERWRARRGG